MQHLKKLFNFYIFSNIHVAFATFSLTKITLLTNGISENTTPLFVFFSTIISYNTIRFLRLNKLSIWFNRYKKELYFLTAISSLLLIYYFLKLNLKAFLMLIPFSLMTGFYVFPIQKYSLRNIASLKLFLIAFSWAGITVLFPIIQNYLIPTTTNYISFLQRFLFVLAITIPFDIRDLKTDAKKLKTLPQQIGIKKSKFLGVLFLILSFCLEFFKSEINATTLLILLITFTLSSALLLKATKKQNKYYSAFFVEAIPIVWLFLEITLI